MTRCYPSPEQPENVLCLDIPEEVLEDLYARWAAVDQLIRSLEDYQRRRPPGVGKCISFSVARK